MSERNPYISPDNPQNPNHTHLASVTHSLNSTIQLHFDKTLEKKRSIDLQKKHLQKLFLLFFLFLSLAFHANPNLQCRHSWLPISLISLGFVAFYASLAQTLRCINEFKYQRRCHKLTLALATEKLKNVRRGSELVGDDDQVCYQEPPESYLGKFKRTWALYFAFLVLTFGVMVSGILVVLCF